ncbi:MAG: NfeD family protein [Candidatus Planktophila sp.]|jgi:membrane protein implicated in regulation of membrane protease activity|tara:strand:- start:2805 stop:3230 length:426 start_codon:yes stop_codon:yes gene_type:complete
MQLWMWLVASGALLVIEIITVDLLFASLAFASLMAALANALNLSVALQGVTFALAAAISIFILRPIALKHLKKRPADFATNIEALIGAPALALTEVSESAGQVKLNGEIWSAHSISGSIPANTNTLVVSIEGATAVVKEKG